MPYTTPEFIYPITGAGFNGNNRDYQIGPTAADFVGPRPTRVLKANLLLTNVSPNSRVPIVLLPFDGYGDIPVLALPPTGITQAAYYEPAWPNGVLHFFEPIAYNSIELWTSGALTSPATLDTVVAGSFPPGYENAIVYSLAERCQYLCTKQMGPLNPKIAAWAIKARQGVKNLNQQNPKAYTDYRPSGPSTGNYDPNLTYTGNP
jgi:hypothetical protein